MVKKVFLAFISFLALIFGIPACLIWKVSSIRIFPNKLSGSAFSIWTLFLYLRLRRTFTRIFWPVHLWSYPNFPLSLVAGHCRVAILVLVFLVIRSMLRIHFVFPYLPPGRTVQEYIANKLQPFTALVVGVSYYKNLCLYNTLLCSDAVFDKLLLIISNVTNESVYGPDVRMGIGLKNSVI